MSEAVILEAVRAPLGTPLGTPLGRYGGALREVRPDKLLAHAFGGLVERRMPAAENRC